MKANVVAHHSVEYFRPYTINFKDRGNKDQNMIHAIYLAIKREAAWNGWFDEYGSLEGTTLTKVLQAFVEAYTSGKTEVNINAWERTAEELGPERLVEMTNYMFTIWRCDNHNEYGFGFGVPDENGHVLTDKYENKWVCIQG